MTRIKGHVLTLYRETHARFDLLVRHAESLPVDLLTKPLEVFGSKSVRDLLVHILEVERAWIRLLQEKKPPQLDPKNYASVAPIVKEKHRAMTETLAYAETLSDEAFEREIASCPENWVGPARSPAFILSHIITHTFHHKGQVATMFRLLGHPIGDTDLQRAEE